MSSNKTVLATLALFLAAAPSYAQDIKAPVKDKENQKEPAQIETHTVKMLMLPSRHFIVQAKIDGKGPYNFILDTGAPMNLISNKVAKDTGLAKKGGGGLFGGMNQIQIGKLELGGASATKVPSIVIDHPTVKAISDAFEDEHGKIEGIVGFPFFARFAMTVDYQKKEISLKPNGYKPGDLMQDMMKRLMNASESNEPKAVSSSGLWGFALEKDKSDEEAGTKVKTVFADGPAAAAGIKAGDRLLTIDGRWTDSIADVYTATGMAKPGKEVVVVVQRDGKEVKLKLTPTTGR